MSSIKSQLTFGKKIAPSPSRSRNKTSKKKKREAGRKENQYVYLNSASVGIISFKAVLIENCLVKIRMSDGTKYQLIFYLYVSINTAFESSRCYDKRVFVLSET
jgi:hypothetical protein